VGFVKCSELFVERSDEMQALPDCLNKPICTSIPKYSSDIKATNDVDVTTH